MECGLTANKGVESLGSGLRSSFDLLNIHGKTLPLVFFNLFYLGCVDFYAANGMGKARGVRMKRKTPTFSTFPFLLLNIHGKWPSSTLFNLFLRRNVGFCAVNWMGKRRRK